jgi:hypothetical protein
LSDEIFVAVFSGFAAEAGRFHAKMELKAAVKTGAICGFPAPGFTSEFLVALQCRL